MNCKNLLFKSKAPPLLLSFSLFAMLSSIPTLADEATKEDPSRYGLSGSFCDLENLKWATGEKKVTLESFAFDTGWKADTDVRGLISAREKIKSESKDYLIEMIARNTGVTLILSDIRVEPTERKLTLSLVQDGNLFKAIATVTDTSSGSYRAGGESCTLTVEKLVKRPFDEARKLQCDKLVNECRGDTLFSPFSAERKAWYNTVRMDCT